MAELIGLSLARHLDAILLEFENKGTIYGHPSQKTYLGSEAADFSVQFHEQLPSIHKLIADTPVGEEVELMIYRQNQPLRVRLTVLPVMRAETSWSVQLTVNCPPRANPPAPAPATPRERMVPSVLALTLRLPASTSVSSR